MGKKTPKVEVTQYYMSEHFGICAPVDNLIAIYVNEKLAWSGLEPDLIAIPIDKQDLFGGIKKEGGVKGTAYYLPGDDAQLMPDLLAQKLGRADGNDCPGFRGLASLFFIGDDKPGFYWAANSPYVPGVWATVGRAPLSPVPLATFEGWDYEIEFREIYTVFRTISSTFLLDGPGGWVGGPNPASHDFDTIDDGVTDPLIRSSVRRIASTDNPVEYAAMGTGVTAWTGTVDPDFIVEPGGTGNTLRVEVWFRHWSETTATMVDFSNYSSGSGPRNFAWNNSIDTSTLPATGPATSTLIGEDANPAWIIWECLTNVDWGMGSPATAIDEDSFNAAADTLTDEEFGLSMLWTRQSMIQDFIQEVLDHIQAVFYVDPATGLLTLKLIRDDYDPDDLDILTPDNCDVTNFRRKLWGEIVNEITVTWTNPENEQDETVTIQDDASIAMQGGVVSDSRNYYGIRTATLAKMVAVRDLRSAGQPLAQCSVEVDRSQWDARPGGLLKLTWPEYGLSELVMRIQSVDYGKPGDPTIKLELIEDIFGLDIGSYTDPPSSSWTDPSAEPTAMSPVEIFTLPYFFAINSSAAAFIETPEYAQVISGVLASSTNSDTFAFEVWDELTLPNGGTSWQLIATNNVIGYGELSADLDSEVTSTGVAFSNLIGQTSPSVGGFVLIGGTDETAMEIAMIDAGGYTLTRGCLDTVPRAWPAGTPVWFLDAETVYEDKIVRSGGETVDYKLLGRTSLGLYDLASADLESYTLTDRPWLPNRPADCTAYGEAWSSFDDPIDARLRADPWVTVTWAIRNRLDEDAQVLAWDDASATAETGQTTTIEVYDARTATLLDTMDGEAGTTVDVLDASFGDADLVELRVLSKRSDDIGDLVSLQYFSLYVRVADTPIEGEDDVIIEGEDGVTIESED